MSPIALMATLAAVSLLFAALRPGRVVAIIAALLCMMAVALQLPSPGIGGLGGMVAAGLAIAAGGLSAPVARPLLAVALIWSLSAALAPQTAVTAAWSVVFASGLAAVLVIVAVAGLAMRLAADDDRRSRRWTAILLALAPVGSGGPLLPLSAAIELPLADGTGAWLQTSYLAFDPTLLPPWAPLLWRAMPAILLAFVLVAVAVRSRRGVTIAALLTLLPVVALASAWLPLASGHTAAGSIGLVASGQPFGGALRTLHDPMAVSVAPLLLLLARLFTLLLLLLPVGEGAVERGAVWSPLGRRLDAMASVLGGALLLSWALLAPAWAGSTWIFDPAAMAALAAFACGFGVLSTSGRGASARAWRVGQAAAATCVVAGGEVGWRVASTLMLD